MKMIFLKAFQQNCSLIKERGRVVRSWVKLYMKYKTEPLPFFQFGCIFSSLYGSNHVPKANFWTDKHLTISITVFVNKQ